MWKRAMWNIGKKDEEESASFEDTAASATLDRLFVAYRDACPTPDAGPNFMPEIWAKIEARESSTNLFGKMAKTLVTAAVAASVILGLLMATVSQTSANYNGTYLDALMADHASGLEPLNLDRISELEQQ